MALTKMQISFTVGRIDDMLAAQEAALRAEHMKPAKRISDRERYELVRDGKVPLRQNVSEITSYMDVVNVFDFSAFCWPETVDGDAVAKAMAPARKEAQRLKDELVLGDADAALSALREFAAKFGDADG